MLEIIGQPEGEIEVKRFHLEGLEMNIICPECGHKRIWDNYLSYPDMNTPMYLNCYCNKCYHEWDEQIILKVSVELV